MAAARQHAGRKFWQTLSSIKTGVILLILTVIIAAAGTVILQRPVTDPDEMTRAYSPQMLRVLDGMGLTDIFHAWWFVTLLVLVSLSIIAASIERFPNAWRFYARPSKVTDESFRRFLPRKAEIAIPDQETGLAAATEALKKMGLHAQRVTHEGQPSLFAEKHRISEMAVYLVHASLLLIFVGGIVDALYGWRGFVALTKGEQSAQVQLRNGGERTLPFQVRCDAAGQENYSDGTPKKWWSRLAVVEGGHEVMKKEIVVNDPLVYHGVRFYQSSYGMTGKVDTLTLTASPQTGEGASQEVALAPGQTVPLDGEATVQMAEFIPDYVVRDGQVYTRTAQIENPAVHLVVSSKNLAKPVNVWLPPIEGFEENTASPYKFEAKDLKMAYFTGLQVSHEPGQWAVWAGVVLMAFGLAMVFYVIHVRFWAVPVRTAKGELVLWLGGTANRNQDAFEHRFSKFVEQVRAAIPQPAAAGERRDPAIPEDHHALAGIGR